MKAFKHSHTLRIKKEKDCQSHQVLIYKRDCRESAAIIRDADRL